MKFGICRIFSVVTFVLVLGAPLSHADEKYVCFWRPPAPIHAPLPDGSDGEQLCKAAGGKFTADMNSLYQIGSAEVWMLDCYCKHPNTAPSTPSKAEEAVLRPKAVDQGAPSAPGAGGHKAPEVEAAT